MKIKCNFAVYLTSFFLLFCATTASADSFNRNMISVFREIEGGGYGLKTPVDFSMLSTVGFDVADVARSRDGYMIVEKVRHGSLAEKYDMLKGSDVFSIDNMDTKRCSQDDIRYYVADCANGKKSSIRVVFLSKNGTRKLVNIQFGETRVTQQMQLAKSGDVEAMFSLGKMYDEGRYVAKNHKEAETWYKKAAEAGHIGAMRSLGARYFYNNTEESIKWLKQAGLGGDADSALMLAWIYDYNKAYKSGEEAVKWYKWAAGLGNESAKKHLNALGVK